VGLASFGKEAQHFFRDFFEDVHRVGAGNGAGHDVTFTIDRHAAGGQTLKGGAGLGE
jgi:hypothetical protein